MTVKLEKEGKVGVIVLDRPPANSYDYAFLREFASAIDDARADGDVRNVVVTSASEKFFSAGADVAQFAAGTARQRFMTALLAHEAFRKMETSPLIFVAAISGHCLGGLAATLGYGGPIDVGLALEREAIGRVFVSEDADEGIKAFTEKRKASFKGQ